MKSLAARNDVRFKRRKWSVLQIHHAIEADIGVAANCARIDAKTERSRSGQAVRQTMNLQQNISPNAGTISDGRSSLNTAPQQHFSVGVAQRPSSLQVPHVATRSQVLHGCIHSS